MSKERARLREQRLAVAAVEREQRARRVARRDRRRSLARRLTPRLPDRRTGKMFARRSRAERVIIVIYAVAGLAAIWWFTDDWTARVGLSLLLLVALPVLVILAFDRRV